MAQDSSERFRVFISHKHDDHDCAERISKALESLSDRIRCFVSGSDLAAGSDWNAEIRSQLMQGDLLILLFTEPSQNWDWCLYEAGLFTSLGDEHSVVCLYRAQGATPRPLSSLQGVPVEPVAVERFVTQLCHETWRVARKWRLGALAPTITAERLADVAGQIVGQFPRAASVGPAGYLTHYPCHRVVLDLRAISGVAISGVATGGIPRQARVIEGDGATSTFTLSLFNLTRGLRARTWGDLVDATATAADGADGGDGKWLADLDDRFAAALKEQLFSPSKTTPMPLVDSYTGQRRRSYRPILYEILREPVAAAGSDGQADAMRPLQVTILLDPVAEGGAA